MQRNKIKTLIAVLELSTTLSLLGGCASSSTNNSNSKSIQIGDSKFSRITYDENEINGKISYQNLENNCLRIVTLSYNGKVLEPKLMAVSVRAQGGMRGPHWKTKEYIDLETGVLQIHYRYPTTSSKEEEASITFGENFEIVEEISLLDFIIQENWLQDEYDVNELIKFFNEKVKPALVEDTNGLSLEMKFRQNI